MAPSSWHRKLAIPGLKEEKEKILCIKSHEWYVREVTFDPGNSPIVLQVPQPEARAGAAKSKRVPWERMTWGLRMDRPLRESFLLKELVVTQPVSGRHRILIRSCSSYHTLSLSKWGWGTNQFPLWCSVCMSWTYLLMLPPSFSVWGWKEPDMGGWRWDHLQNVDQQQDALRSRLFPSWFSTFPEWFWDNC